jgi:hypothetical protein
MASVLQLWTDKISLKAQAVLISAIRRPDGVNAKYSSDIVRWIRANTLNDGNAGKGDFLKTNDLPSVEDKEFQKEFVTLSLHAVLHIIHAVEVIGYCHPDEDIQTAGTNFYTDICDMFHMNHEGINIMKLRLSDGNVANCWK